MNHPGFPSDKTRTALGIGMDILIIVYDMAMMWNRVIGGIEFTRMCKCAEGSNAT